MHIDNKSQIYVQSTAHHTIRSASSDSVDCSSDYYFIEVAKKKIITFCSFAIKVCINSSKG